MQFRDLKRQYEALRPEIDQALQRVLGSAHFIMGQEVSSLEDRLAQYVGVRHCVACASGTDALRLAMMLAQVGAGDAVFVPDFTFYATAEVVLAQGATPIFVDVDESTFNIDVEDLRRKISQVRKESALSPKAVIAVDLFGLPANYREVARLTQDEGLLLVEDAAQGFGGSLDGQKACSFGSMAATSFFPAKPLGCYGDGGAFFTNDDDLALQARSIIQHGKGSNKYDNVRLGLNSRLDAIQAAILHVKLDAFDSELNSVRQVAATYGELLSQSVLKPVCPEGALSSWAQYTIRLADSHQRDHVKSVLASAGVPSMVYYPRPLHRLPVFASLTASTICSHADHLSNVVLSLPMHPYITSQELQQVAAALNEALTSYTQ